MKKISPTAMCLTGNTICRCIAITSILMWKIFPVFIVVLRFICVILFRMPVGRCARECYSFSTIWIFVLTNSKPNLMKLKTHMHTHSNIIIHTPFFTYLILYICISVPLCLYWMSQFDIKKTITILTHKKKQTNKIKQFSPLELFLSYF